MPYYVTGKPLEVERAEKKAERRTTEDAKKKAAKARDSYTCRWPRFDHDTPNHRCLGAIEASHQKAKGMGGNPDGSRTTVKALLTACHWIHQRSPDALERHGREWQGISRKDGANGPVIFYRVHPGCKREEIAREKRIGELA